MRNAIDPSASNSDFELQQTASTLVDGSSTDQKLQNHRLSLRSGRLRETGKVTLSNRELKAGMIRILGAAKAATYLGLIRKDSVMRQEMLRLVVAHSIL